MVAKPREPRDVGLRYRAVGGDGGDSQGSKMTVMPASQGSQDKSMAIKGSSQDFISIVGGRVPRLMLITRDMLSITGTTIGKTGSRDRLPWIGDPGIELTVFCRINEFSSRHLLDGDG